MNPPMLDRRRFLLAAAAALGAPRAASAQTSLTPREEGGVAWHDVKEWGVEGKGWADTARYYDRLPARAEGVVRKAVWDLSRHSAGMLVHFETDAPVISARYTLYSANLAMPHMPATGVSGLDLYGRDERGRDRWVGVIRPTAQRVEGQFPAGIDPLPGGAARLYSVYLPLYNGVETLELGVPPKASFRRVPPRRERAIVFYGTSIMHGACASRPGMSISAILGRRFDRPTINLGFSGNGRMEPEVGALLAELDAAVYAIDCLPNMTGPQVAERTEPLVRQLRQARPGTPILLVEDRSFTNAPFLKAMRDRHSESRAAFRKAYENLVDGGVKGLSYLPGEGLLGEDGEGATDGSHPNDLGMVRYADAYEKALRPILRG